MNTGNGSVVLSPFSADCAYKESKSFALLCSARVGRGGRLILSRCQPFTLEPLEPDQQPTEELQRPPFDLMAPYAAAEAQHQQEEQQLPRQQSQSMSQGQLQQPSPSRQPAKPVQQPGGPARQQASGPTQAQAAAPSQLSQPIASQTAGQQTRQQQQQQHPQLIEMPSQPGANGPSPPKSKVRLLLSAHSVPLRGVNSCNRIVAVGFYATLQFALMPWLQLVLCTSCTQVLSRGVISCGIYNQGFAMSVVGTDSGSADASYSCDHIKFGLQTFMTW